MAERHRPLRAEVDISPETLSGRTGLAFVADVDDLDYFRPVGLELLAGRHVVLALVRARR